MTARPKSRMSPSDAARVARNCAAELIESFPDLADDPEAFIGTLDGECDALDVAARLVERALERDDMAEQVDYLLAQRKEAADALRERRGRFQRQGDRLRDAAAQILAACQVEGAPKPKLVRASFTASLRQTASDQRKLLCIDASQTPDELKVQPPPEPDKAAIRKALLGGQDVPGWALANDTGPTLQVRVK